MKQITTVPDTLDLADRMGLALHGIGETCDPADDFLIYFDAYWNHNPPFLKHSGVDIEIMPKFLEALAQLRVATGSDAYGEVEEGVLNYLTGCVEADGLFYARWKPERPWHMRTYEHAGYTTEPVDYATPITAGHLMIALAGRNGGDEKGRWDELLGRLARGVEKACLFKDDYAYFPTTNVAHPFTRPRSGWTSTAEPGDEHASGEGSVVCFFGPQIRGLSMWARQSGDERALDLAGRLARFVMKPRFWGHPADPARLCGHDRGHVDSHFHARCIALRGLLDYAHVAGDPQVADFVRTAYEYIRAWGIPRIGFAPSWVNGERLCMETCHTVDLVSLAIKLSDYGLGDYWDDADAVTRNHLVESQLTDLGVLERIVAATPREEGGEVATPGGENVVTMVRNRPPAMGKLYGPNQASCERVLERCHGIFASYLMPDYAYNWRTMQCCTANGARGLYSAWEGITRCDAAGDAQVNLLLNREAPWLGVESHLPYEGAVTLRNRNCRRISVRIPGWVDRRHLRCRVNGAERPARLVGHYLVVDGTQPGDAVRLDFPVREETILATAHAKTPSETVYTIRLRGGTVVDIAPRETNPLYVPFYRREAMRSAGPAPVKPAGNTGATAPLPW